MSVRHGVKKKVSKPTLTPPLISCGDKDRSLLRYLFELGDERFNVKAYSVKFGVPRGSIYDSLNRLIKKGLINKPSIANFVITNQGRNFVEIVSGKGVGRLHRGCRDGTLSVHNCKFVLPFSNSYRLCDLEGLGARDFITVNLKNLVKHYLYYESVTLVVSNKRIVVHVREFLGDDVDDVLLRSFNVALKYIDLLKGVGFVFDNILLETTDFARVESALGDFLSKVDDRYFLDLGDGEKFWIDNSQGKLEDETNSADYRERLDGFMKDLGVSESKLSDLDRMRNVVGELLEVMKLQGEQNLATATGLHGVVDIIRGSVGEKKEDLDVRGSKDKSYFG